VTDAPFDRFHGILNDWKKSKPTEKDLREMQEFLEEHCPKWNERV